MDSQVLALCLYVEHKNKPSPIPTWEDWYEQGPLPPFWEKE